MRLVDRSVETAVLDELLGSVRAGMSGALVLRGEPGIGKSALLDHAVERAADLQVLRTVAVESEQAVGFAGAHQILAPLLPTMDRLPEPQRQALGVALGLVSGPAANPFLVGLAALTLLSDAAEERPVLCVVDDAQWLDEESADTLSFVARRLLADRVGMLFAVRETTGPDPRLRTLPTVRVTGLPPADARELLRASLGPAVDGSVAERIVAETGGNPLAVLEAARELTPDQLAGRAPLPEPLPLGHRLDLLFDRRVRKLPPDTQALVLLAAAGHPGRGPSLWQAARALAIPESAAVPAEIAGLVDFWPEVRFSHPLVRSAVYYSATPGQRRRAHRVLAAACDPELDADARAWHLAAGAAGPDEAIAAQQEAAAVRARNRGGYAGAAALFERAVLLTPERERRAKRQLAAAQVHLLAGSVDRASTLLGEATTELVDPRSTAQATRLDGRILAARGRVADAAAELVDAARRLCPFDPAGARAALLSALEATVFAGWGPSAALLHEIAHIAGDVPATREPADAAATLLLEGYVMRVTDGYAAAVPTLRRAVEAFLADEADPETGLQRLELAAVTAVDLLDDAWAERLTARWIDCTRERGALARLAGALAFRSAFVDGPAGRLAAATAAEAEARDLGEVTHNPAIVPPSGAHTLLTLALGGRVAEGRATAAAVAREAPSRGALGELAMAAYFAGVLDISLGDYGSAMGHLDPAYTDDTPLAGTVAMPDLVEAAVRAGRPDVAERALQRLEERATATGTALALGLLARSRALLAAPAEAREQYEEAIHLLRRTRAVTHVARAHLLYGEWLRRQRRRTEARDQLRTAHDLFDAMGLRVFAERAGVELRATGEHARKRADGSPEELTPQEAQIATLVSRGEPNRDIAAQLFISPSTVEYHLRKVFRKLGVTSRTQLARRVLEQDVDLGGAMVGSRGAAEG